MKKVFVMASLSLLFGFAGAALFNYSMKQDKLEIAEIESDSFGERAQQVGLYGEHWLQGILNL